MVISNGKISSAYGEKEKWIATVEGQDSFYSEEVKIFSNIGKFVRNQLEENVELQEGVFETLTRPVYFNVFQEGQFGSVFSSGDYQKDYLVQTVEGRRPNF